MNKFVSPLISKSFLTPQTVLIQEMQRNNYFGGTKALYNFIRQVHE